MQNPPTNAEQNPPTYNVPKQCPDPPEKVKLIENKENEEEYYIDYEEENVIDYEEENDIDYEEEKVIDYDEMENKIMNLYTRDDALPGTTQPKPAKLIHLPPPQTSTTQKMFPHTEDTIEDQKDAYPAF